MVSIESPIPIGSGRDRLEALATVGPKKSQLISVIFYLYRGALTPMLAAIGGAGNGCRFEETCSHFAERKLHEQGFRRALPLIVQRILSCNPWYFPRKRISK